MSVPHDAGAPGGRLLHRLRGGLRLRHHKQVSCARPVERPVLPDVLIVPLQQHLGLPAQALVQAGDRVLKGQRLGEVDLRQPVVLGEAGVPAQLFMALDEQPHGECD